MAEQYSSFQVSSLTQIHRLRETLNDGWIYRGQENAIWGLKPSFQRAAERFKCQDFANFSVRERMIIQEFKQKAYFYKEKIPHFPADDELIEWLCLLQHFSGPTRILDFTDSIYIALYFAIENASQSAAVWMVNLDKLNEGNKFAQRARIDITTLANEKKLKWISHIIDTGKSQIPLVADVRPLCLSERIRNQQGLFLCPMDISQTFEVNLCSSLGYPDHATLEFVKNNKIDFDDLMKELVVNDFKILQAVIPIDFHSEVIRGLYDMRITAEMLLPGLDGFAQSLKIHLR